MFIYSYYVFLSLYIEAHATVHWTFQTASGSAKQNRVSGGQLTMGGRVHVSWFLGEVGGGVVRTGVAAAAAAVTAHVPSFSVALALRGARG